MIDEDIDTAQAMADLDVIFANDRLDAILGSTQPIPAEDACLGTMLGLEVLEDLAQAYPGDTDFQQTIDGCGSICPRVALHGVPRLFRSCTRAIMCGGAPGDGVQL